MNPVAELVRQFFDFHTNTEDRLNEGLRRIRHLERDMANIHDLIQTLNTKVSSQNSVIEGVQTTLATLSQSLKDAQSQIASTGDVSLLTDIISGVDQHTQALATAIAQNTPAAADPVPSEPAAPVTTDTPLTPVSSDTGSTDNSGGNTPAATDTPAADAPATDTPAPAATDTPTDGSTNS